MTTALTGADLTEIQARRSAALNFLRIVGDAYRSFGDVGQLSDALRFVDNDARTLFDEIARQQETINAMREDEQEAQGEIEHLKAFSHAMDRRVKTAETHATKLENSQPDRDAYEEEKARTLLDSLDIPRRGEEGNILTLSERIEVLSQAIKK